MDPKPAPKLKGKKSFNKKNNNARHQYVHNLVLHLLIALACSFFCSYYSFHLPSPPSLSTLKQFLFISIPSMRSSMMNPACLFVVMNVIIAVLIGEWRIKSSRVSSRTDEIYDEYVERSRSLRRRRSYINCSDLPKKIIKKEKEAVTMEINSVIISGDVEEKKEATNQVELSEVSKGNEKVDEDGADELPTEELNRRVEKFIARVNRQRLLEARSLMSHGTVCPTEHFGRTIAVRG